MLISAFIFVDEVLTIRHFLLVFNRSLLLAELEKEEKEKDWYYAQLQNLTKRIDSLPLTENVSNCSMLPSLMRCSMYPKNLVIFSNVIFI